MLGRVHDGHFGGKLQTHENNAWELRACSGVHRTGLVTPQCQSCPGRRRTSPLKAWAPFASRYVVSAGLGGGQVCGDTKLFLVIMVLMGSGLVCIVYVSPPGTGPASPAPYPAF